MLRVFFFFLLTLPFLFSCSKDSSNLRTSPINKPPKAPSPLDQKVSMKPSVETPLTPPVNPNSLDKCTRHLLFANQYLSASDYESAFWEVEEASKYCSHDDPRYNYVKAVLLDVLEKKEEAYKYYYKAAKGYLKEGDYRGLFKCYSGMMSIKPNGQEVKELQKYFLDEDY